ncbi:unnamed protein product [Caenorhabditis nigoni]
MIFTLANFLAPQIPNIPIALHEIATSIMTTASDLNMICWLNTWISNRAMDSGVGYKFMFWLMNISAKQPAH